MKSVYVDWNGKVKLTWLPIEVEPLSGMITSVHAFCFQDEKLLLVDLNHRGWDIPGGHIDPGESPIQALKREVMEEAYVEGEDTLLGYIEVSHEENPSWNVSCPYPLIGYQAFYRMDITKIHDFEALFESSKRTLISPEKARTHMKGWHGLFNYILQSALYKKKADGQVILNH